MDGTVRTIPTRVGKTEIVEIHSGGCPDHPHAGGENSASGRWRAGLSGPSPRGWGKPLSADPFRVATRTIPTRVGKTTQRLTLTTLGSDHPHAGGENPHLPTDRARTFGPSPRGWENHYLGIDGTWCEGPSPRGWGKPAWRRSLLTSQRTIPTRVGKTREGTVGEGPLPDHPHAGGENRTNPAIQLAFNGPSPRGWEN